MGRESEQITTLVNDLLSQAKRTIIFNIAGITKIDSTGMGRFISSYNQVAAARCGWREHRDLCSRPFTPADWIRCSGSTQAWKKPAKPASSDAEREHHPDCR